MHPATTDAKRREPIPTATRHAQSTRRLAEWIRAEPELLAALLHDASGDAATPALVWNAAQRSLRLTPDNAELLYQAGAAALRASDRPGATACLERAIEF